MKKNEIKEILMKMKTRENEESVNYLLGLLDIKSDEEIETLLTKHNIKEGNIADFFAAKIEKLQTQQEQSEHFTSVNKMFCYGRTGNTMHMHLIPKDLRGLKTKLGDEAFYQYFKDQLEDFLSRMQDIFRNDSSVELLFAVSPIFFNPNISLVHEQLGFDKITEIDLENGDDQMSIEQKKKFLNMFGGKKRVYYTSMSREKLLETEYGRISEGEKTIIDD